jgi:hypothetical protein
VYGRFVDRKRENTFNVEIFVLKATDRAFRDSGEILLWELLEADATEDRELLERCAATSDTENCWRDVPPQSIQRIVGEMCRHSR